VRSFQDYTIFNSVNPDTLTPKVRHPRPFPLENLDQEISMAFECVNKILIKLKVASENPVNFSPARKKRLKALQYKTKTCLKLIQEISAETEELWF